MSIQDLTTMIQAGHGIFTDDPQSGSILKLLGENGFKQKMESGIANGHTYTIIHNPPSPEFVLVDNWSEGNNHKKAYHAFSVRTQPVQSTLSTSTKEVPEQEHPLIVMLRELNTSAEQLLNQSKKYV